MMLHSDMESKKANSRDIFTGNDDYDDDDEIQCDTGVANSNQASSGPEATVMNPNNATLDTGVARRRKTKEDEENGPTKEYNLHKIVDHRASKNRRNRNSRYSETLYGVQCYDRGPERIQASR